MIQFKEDEQAVVRNGAEKEDTMDLFHQERHQGFTGKITGTTEAFQERSNGQQSEEHT